MADTLNDDQSVHGADPLWRRIPPGRWTYDHNTGRLRPDSDCFKYSRDKATGDRHPMSVALGKEVKGGAVTVLRGHGDFRLVGFTAGLVRDLELGVSRDPDPDPWHALVFSLHGQNEIPKIARNRLAEAAEWVVFPSEAEVEEARNRTRCQS